MQSANARRAWLQYGATLLTGSAVVLTLFSSLKGTADSTPPLREVSFPKRVEPANIGSYVKDRNAAIRLGKALFWDMQVGSDGVVSCATCHSHAFADNRTKNQLNPGPNGRFDFGGVNRTLKLADFPVRSDEVVGSQGVVKAKFNDIVLGQAEENRTLIADPIFHQGNVNTRQVTGKNAPTAVHAAFNHRNFWNGRANNKFNGVSPFGDGDASVQGMLWAVQPNGSVATASVSLDSSAAASQAVGPTLNSVEMSYDGRTWPKVAKKLFHLTPLGKQLVHAQDSVLGGLSKSPNRGLNAAYLNMIQDAFDPQWWNSNAVFTLDAAGKPVLKGTGTPAGTNEFSLAEVNFSLFWGLAIQEYESTLAADDTPMDRFLKGVPDPRFGALEQQGLALFNSDRGRCNQCHTGGLMTSASVANVALVGETQSRALRDGPQAFFDTGFFNIGVRPTAEDAGVGGLTPFGTPLNFSRVEHAGQRVAVDGAFKVPGLRNIALMGPYFHTGGKATLEQVLEFYHDRGDFRSVNRANVANDLEQIRIGGSDQRALVAFLRNGLTDDRTANESAPFDHPELFVANGHLASGADDLVRLPPTGATGRSAEGLPPLKPFLQ